MLPPRFFDGPHLCLSLPFLLVLALHAITVRAQPGNGVGNNATFIAPVIAEADPDVNTVADSIHYVAFASQWISIPGSLFIIGFTIYHREAISRKGPAHRFPLYISIADLGFTVTHFSDHMVVLTTGHYPKHDACLFFGWIFQFMSVATIMCVMCVSLYCAYTVWFLKRPDMGRYDWKLIAFGYGVPFVFSFIPFITSSYGHDAAWCWIDQTKPNSHLGYIVIPYLLFLVCNICTLAIIFFCLATSSANTRSNTRSNMVKRSILFVLAYIFQFTPIIVFSIQVYKGVDVPYDTVLFVVFNTNLGGFLNVIVYGFGILNIGGGTKHHTKHDKTTAGSLLNYKTSQMEQGLSPYEEGNDPNSPISPCVPHPSIKVNHQSRLVMISNSSGIIHLGPCPLETTLVRVPHPESFTSNSTPTPSAEVPASSVRAARFPIRVHSTPDTASELLRIVKQQQAPRGVLTIHMHRLNTRTGSQINATGADDSTTPSTGSRFPE